MKFCTHSCVNLFLCDILEESSFCLTEVQLDMFCWIVHCLINKLAKFKSLLRYISLSFLGCKKYCNKTFFESYKFKDIAVLQSSSENKCATIKAFETGPQYHYVLVIPSIHLCIGGNVLVHQQIQRKSQKEVYTMLSFITQKSPDLE